MKPILFNTQMVQAILEGRKTTTRRVIKNIGDRKFVAEEDSKYDDYKFCDIEKNKIGTCYSNHMYVKPPYKIGDILYVRETWCKLFKLDDCERIIEGTDKFYYRADGYNPTPFNCFPDEDGFNGERDCPRWRPSIHMPKEAARIFLKVTDIRVEQLRYISAGECKAEGIDLGYKISTSYIASEYCNAFGELWDSTIKKKDLDKYGWKTNPWVWVIEFERCEKPNEV